MEFATVQLLNPKAFALQIPLPIALILAPCCFLLLVFIFFTNILWFICFVRCDVLQALTPDLIDIEEEDEEEQEEKVAAGERWTGEISPKNCYVTNELSNCSI